MNLNLIYAGELLRIGRLLTGRRKPPVGMPDDCILHDGSKYTKVHKKGRCRYRDREGKFYEWDALHGEIEVYNKKGEHMAVKNSKGETIKKGITGRKISVR